MRALSTPILKRSSPLPTNPRLLGSQGIALSRNQTVLFIVDYLGYRQWSGSRDNIIVYWPQMLPLFPWSVYSIVTLKSRITKFTAAYTFGLRCTHCRGQSSASLMTSLERFFPKSTVILRWFWYNVPRVRWNRWRDKTRSKINIDKVEKTARPWTPMLLGRWKVSNLWRVICAVPRLQLLHLPIQQQLLYYFVLLCMENFQCLSWNRLKLINNIRVLY